MALTVGSIAAKMVLNITDFSQKLKQAQDQVQQTRDKMEGFSKVGAGFTNVGKGLMLGVTAPVVALGTAVVKTSATFQQSMAKVQAISGASGEDMVKLTSKAKEMGATTQFSASQSAEALQYMAMAGWKTNQMMDALPAIMNAAAASGEDLGTVSDIVTDAMTAFGMKADEAAGFTDTLAAAANNSNTGIGLLGESFKYVAPVAGALGYSAKDASIALGLMANSGIKGSQAGTSLRGALTRLIQPTSDSAKLMEKYGISLKNSDGSMKSLQDVMNMLRDKLGGLDKAQQTQIATQLFGQESMSGMLAIINATEGDYGKLTDAIYNADGASQKMADTMNNTLTGKIGLLKSALEGVAIKIGDLLLPMVTNIVEKITNWVEWFGNLDQSTQKVILVVAGLAASVGPLLVIFGTLMGSVVKISAGMKILSGIFTLTGIKAGLLAVKTNVLAIGTKLAAAAQWLLNVAMSMNPISLIIIAITALIAVFVLLWNKCEGFRNFWINLWNICKTKFFEFCDWVKAKWDEFWAWLPQAWANFKQGWNDFWESCKQKFWDCVNWIIQKWNDLWIKMKVACHVFKDKFLNIWEDLKTTFFGFVDYVKQVWGECWQWIQDNFSNTIQAIQNIWTGLTTFFSGAIELLKTVLLGPILIICDVITGDWENLKTDTMNIFSNLGEALGLIWEGIKQVFWGAVDLIKGYVMDWCNLVVGYIKTKWGELKAWWNGFWSDLWNYVKTAWDNMYKSVCDKCSQIMQYVKTKWNGLMDWFAALPGRLYRYGADMFERMKQAVIEKVTSAIEWTKQKWNSLMDWFAGLPGRLYAYGCDMFNRMRDGVVSTVMGVYEAVKSGIGTAIDWLKSLPGQAIEWGRHMIEGFIDGVKSKVGALVDSVKGVAQNIRNFLGFTVPKMGPLHVYQEWMPHMIEGMSETLEQRKGLLIDKARGIAGSLSEAMNGGNELAFASDLRVDGYTQVKNDLTDRKNPNSSNSNVSYNINIERLDVNKKDDVRQLAEELEAFRRRQEI